MYQRILCPIDGSDASSAGLDEAIKFAQQQGATIKLLYIIDRCWLRDRSSRDDCGEQLLRRGIRILETAKAKVAAASVNVLTTLSDGSSGTVADDIIENCKLWRADLIVIGTQGCHGSGDIFIGKDAEAVIRTSEVPVLLVNVKSDSGQRLILAATKRYQSDDALLRYSYQQLPYQRRDKIISNHRLEEVM